MVEDAAIARDAINRLTTLLVKSDVTPEEIRDVANDVQIKDPSRLSSRAEIDEARTDAWPAICDLADAVKTSTADIEWQNAIASIWALAFSRFVPFPFPLTSTGPWRLRR